VNDSSGIGAFLAGLGLIAVVAPLVWWFVCGVIAAVIAENKGRSAIGFFCLGLFFLGPFAIAVAILASPIERPRAVMRPAVAQPPSQPKKIPATPQPAAVARPKPPPGVLAAGASVKVIAVGDDHEDQAGIVHALLDDEGDGLTVSVKFKGDREPYAFRRDELKLE
jgi:hypothetical protein